MLVQKSRRIFPGRSFPSIKEPLEKYSVLHLKLLTDLQDNHPYSFVPLMRPSLELVCGLCFSSAERVEADELVFKPQLHLHGLEALPVSW